MFLTDDTIPPWQLLAIPEQSESGDELRGSDQIWRVIKREDEMLLIDGGRRRYWMSLDRWQEWCEKSGAVATAACLFASLPETIMELLSG